eukprot:scaffold592447_cov11-Prasinocladus_malaysianus.AAC.1
MSGHLMRKMGIPLTEAIEQMQGISRMRSTLVTKDKLELQLRCDDQVIVIRTRVYAAETKDLPLMVGRN